MPADTQGQRQKPVMLSSTKGLKNPGKNFFLIFIQSMSRRKAAGRSWVTGGAKSRSHDWERDEDGTNRTRALWDGMASPVTMRVQPPVVGLAWMGI